MVGLNKFNKLSCALYLKYPCILAGLFSFNVLADCTNQGGVISTPTTTACTVSGDGSIVTVDSTANNNIYFDGKDEQLIVNSGGKVEFADGSGGAVRVRSLSNTTWQLTNNGTISNPEKTASSSAIIIANELGTASNISATINNNGTIYSEAASGITVLDNSGNIIVNNNESGIITSGKDATAGIRLWGNSSSNATADINNKGVISVNGANAVAISSMAGNVTSIRNSGTISTTGINAILTGGADDSLILESTSVIQGIVDLGSGNDSLVLAGASGTGTLSDMSTYKNIENLTKDEDSTWIVKGASNAFTGGTTVKAGNLFLGDDNSKLTSNVTIQQGGTFGGYGSVKGDVTNSGTLVLASAAKGFEGGAMSNFTINGNYTGNNGNLVMNMALNDDTTSTGSKLIITGDTKPGTTAVTVNNVGGNGGQTVEGIEVIDVGGASDGTFTQNGRIVAGAYDYYLVKGSTSAPTDGNWYLTSKLSETPTPDPEPTPDPDPTPNPDPTPDPTPAPAPAPDAPPVRPEAGSYLGNQSAAKDMFMSTMHDRMGEQNLTQSLASDDVMPSTWMRVSGSRTEGHAAGSIDQSTDTSMFQLGNDITTWSSSGSDRGHVGFMFGYGYAKTDSYSANSKAGNRNSTGKAKGYNVGLYGTWYADAKSMNGLYIDSSLQYSWFNNETQGEQLATEKYDSDLWQLSLETGYALQVIDNADKSLFLEPQAQVIYSTMKTDDFHEQNGTLIHDADSDGYTTRLGTRMFGRTLKDTTAVEPFIEVNWWHDTAANSIKLDADKVYSDTPASYYEVKGGVEGKINNNFHSWANVGYQTGENDYSQVTGMVGVKYVW